MDFLSLKLFTLLLFIFSLRVDGRENFSKFTHVVNTQINEKMNNNNVNETAVPNKVDPLEKQNEDDLQDPTFVPETQNAYGLYGRDNSPKEKTTPYYSENNSGSYYYNNNNNNHNNNYDDQFENGVQEDMITDTSLLGSGYTTPLSSKGYKNGDTRYNSEEQGNRRQYHNGESLYNSDEELENSNLYSKYNSNNRGNRYNSNQYNTENKYESSNEQQYYNGANNRYNNQQQQNYNGVNRYNNEQQNYNGANKYNNYNGANTYNTEKQGMSDTRFLENGRYYYDVNNEQNYHRDYNTQRYVSNNENAYEFDKSADEYKYQQYP